MKHIYQKITSSNYEKLGKDVDVFVDLDPVNYTLFVYFQGSNSDIDWRHNFNFPSKVYKRQKSCLRAHRGFVKAFKSANDAITAKIKELSETYLIPVKDLKVTFTGHSFGGAMAILAAEDFYFRFGQKPNVVTFGAPRVLANKKSVKYLESCCEDIFQFAHRSDIVTYVPPHFKHIKKHKLGKFSLKGLFQPIIYHLIYGEDIY